MGDNEKQEKKATRKSISLETKMQVIRRLDSGERQSQISAAMNLATSTIRTIIKNKEKILSTAMKQLQLCLALQLQLPVLEITL
ncbi:hypothetical protein TNCV_4353741 [Trichonephila clavipes]|nr:hypothetical protein TNCV_4353741 [Trichonephila clavipes]